MDEKRIVPVTLKQAIAEFINDTPRLEDLFCVVCALPTGGVQTFCSQTCEDLWCSYDTGRIDWAVFYELSLS